MAKLNQCDEIFRVARTTDWPDLISFTQQVTQHRPSKQLTAFDSRPTHWFLYSSLSTFLFTQRTKSSKKWIMFISEESAKEKCFQSRYKKGGSRQHTGLWIQRSEFKSCDWDLTNYFRTLLKPLFCYAILKTSLCNPAFELTKIPRNLISWHMLPGPVVRRLICAQPGFPFSYVQKYFLV